MTSTVLSCQWGLSGGLRSPSVRDGRSTPCLASECWLSSPALLGRISKNCLQIYLATSDQPVNSLQRLGTHWDITWLGFDVFIWSDLEVQLAIICASVPSLRVLFRQYLSDPITRAINSARSTAERSANRDSRQTEDARILATAPWKRLAEDEENKPVTGKGDDMLETVREIREDHTACKGKLDKTPGEYESVALDDLRRLKASQLYTGWRASMSDD